MVSCWSNTHRAQYGDRERLKAAINEIISLSDVSTHTDNEYTCLHNLIIWYKELL